MSCTPRTPTPCFMFLTKVVPRCRCRNCLFRSFLRRFILRVSSSHRTRRRAPSSNGFEVDFFFWVPFVNGPHSLSLHFLTWSLIAFLVLTLPLDLQFVFFLRDDSGIPPWNVGFFSFRGMRKDSRDSSISISIIVELLVVHTFILHDRLIVDGRDICCCCIHLLYFVFKLEFGICEQTRCNSRCDLGGLCQTLTFDVISPFSSRCTSSYPEVSSGVTTTVRIVVSRACIFNIVVRLR